MAAIPVLLTGLMMTVSGNYFQTGSGSTSFTRFNSMSECQSALRITMTRAKRDDKAEITDEIDSRQQLKIEYKWSSAFSQYQVLKCDPLEVERDQP